MKGRAIHSLVNLIFLQRSGERFGGVCVPLSQKNTIRSWRVNFGSYIMIWIMSHVQIWKLEHKEGWAKHWCFWTVVLEETLESHLGSKEIKPVNPRGNQPWIFTGRTDAKAEATTLWLCGKVLTHWKDPDAGKDWGQEEKWVKEDEMVWWHH